MSKFHPAKEVTQGLGFCISAPSLLRVMELDWPYFLLPLSMSYSSMEGEPPPNLRIDKWSNVFCGFCINLYTASVKYAYIHSYIYPIKFFMSV